MLIVENKNTRFKTEPWIVKELKSDFMFFFINVIMFYFLVTILLCFNKFYLCDYLACD